MFDAASHLATIYASLGEPVTPAAGEVFNALFTYEGGDAFEGASAARATLQYPVSGSPELVEGSVVTVRGAQWELSEDPLPIGGGYELSAPLQRV